MFNFVLTDDANRVMLSTDGEECNNSYINANYINVSIPYPLNTTVEIGVFIFLRKNVRL